jgi:chromosome segregation protein
MEVQLKEVATGIKAERPTSPVDTGTVYPNIQRLRYKLELIGGIDPETVKEFEETQSRFTFLEAQVKDLNDAAGSTEKALDELDKDIKEQSEGAFKDINKEFQRFFKILFGGGSCNLVQLTRDDLATEEEGEPAATSQAQEEQHHEIDTASDLVRDKIKAREDRIVGIDIQATPPGKRLKALNLLSGGERALTSIALVAAIMAVNPAPFVVLDEVDAALDEANTYRFAAILQELAKLTQFIVITHNRATMEKADVLYGVTMGDDGISNLISVKLEELGDVGAARR